MAIKIHKPGVVPATIPMMAECRHCGCRFSFLASDAKYQFDQRDGDYYELPCPTCTKPVTKAVPK